MVHNSFADLVDGFRVNKDRVAMVIRPFLKTQRLSYYQLQRQCYKSANYLLSRGIKKGDRVLVVAPNSPQWVEVFLGCQLIGAILVPVDARNNTDTVNNFIDQTKPKLILRGNNVLPELDNTHNTTILNDYERLIENESVKTPNIKLNGSETSVIVFTSGTTADPKGVELTQKNILSNVSGVKKAIEINPNWRVLSILPLSHMYELTGECCMLASGACIYYLPRITPLAIVKALNEYKITTLLAVPQLLILFRQRILQNAKLEGKVGVLTKALKIAPHVPFKYRRYLFRRVHKKLGGNLSIVVTGGAPIPVEVANFWENLGVKAVQGYGLTETSPILTANRLNNRRSDSQGLPLHNLKLRIGENGEIQAKGENIFKGYWQNPKATKASFTKDGWFKTGDIGKFEDGWLKIQGRLKFAIVLSSGLNVFPEDIETIAENDKTINEICVVGVSKPEGEEVHAVIISDNNDHLVSKAIDDINDKLEPYQHIGNWSRWPNKEFPRTMLLKVDRKNVQNWANKLLDNKSTEQVDQKYDRIADIIRQVINNPNKVINDKARLSDVGLDSLRRLAVLSLIEEQLKITIDESAINQKTTVLQLRKMIEHGHQTATEVKRAAWQYNRLVRLMGNTIRDTLARAILRIWVKITVEGANNIKYVESPAIYIFNHIDYFDAGVMYMALPKKIRDHLSVAVAQDILVKHISLVLFSRICFAGYNFDRQKNIMSSLEYTAELIDRGWNIALAPEGKITVDGKPQPFKSGIGLLAVETGVPIVPVKIIGLYGTFPIKTLIPKRHSKVTVKIGKPLKFDSYTDYNYVTKLLQQTLHSM